jgi:hypothetical protein
LPPFFYPNLSAGKEAGGAMRKVMLHKKNLNKGLSMMINRRINNFL